MPIAARRRWGPPTPLGIAGIYAVVSIAWIYAGDRLVAAIVGRDVELATQLQSIKGVAFVIASATMIYLLSAAAARAIRREQGMAHAVLEQLAEAVTVRDLEGRTVYINAAGAAMLGRPAREILGRVASELVETELAADVAAHDAQALARPGTSYFSERSVGHGPARRVFRTTRIAFADEDGRVLGLIALTRDITSRVIEEERARASDAARMQREKLEALGRLAGGVAHDFNNLLTVIGTAAELASDALAGDASTNGGAPGSGEVATARADLDEVRHATRRAADLTRRLLAFARHHPAGRDRIDVDAVVFDMVALVKRTLHAGVDIVVERGEGAHMIDGDPTALGQVVLNLALNAADAMPGGGVVVVSIDAREEPLADGAPRRWVALTVSDQGVGMEEATRQRALEPFFTTKPDGEGTGIGLATADAIVREHGGRMELASAPGEGTTVTVLLPAASSDGAAEVRAPIADGVARVDDAPVVLLAEDEAAVRTLARRALQRAGFAVAEARHGADALRLVESGVQPRLVVTDVAMPELSGVALAERLRARDPSMPVLFISGYTAGESIPSVRSASGRTAFLQKPFSADALVRAAIGLMNGDGARIPSPGTEHGDGVGTRSRDSESGL